jgi:DNA-binding response OmpR family regulator
MNILLIEPNRLLGNTYRQSLKNAGHKVTLTPGALRAIQAVDKRQPDLIILELQLIGHSGVEFLYEFRSYPEWHHIPVILHTMVPPQSLQISETLLEQLNINAYLYKPSTTLRTLSATASQLFGKA